VELSLIIFPGTNHHLTMKVKSQQAQQRCINVDTAVTHQR